MPLTSGLGRALKLLARGRFAEIGERLRERGRAGLYAHDLGYGLRRDLAAPIEPLKAKIPIEIRPLRESDVPVLFDVDPAATPAGERSELATRRRFLESAIPTCYVAVDGRNGTPCYMQWLIGAAQNPRLAKIGSFPPLEPDEALLEFAYTPAPYRGFGLMSAAMALIAERATEIGARFVITFVAQDNVASMKGCERAGFLPYLVRRQKQYGFNLVHWSEFERLAEGFRSASGRPHA